MVVRRERVVSAAPAEVWRVVSDPTRLAAWWPGVKRVERIWRREGLKVPRRQPERGRLWLNDGSCVRLRPERPNHVWSYDFVEDRTHDGRRFRLLNVLDEFTHECLAIRVSRKLQSPDVIDVLSDQVILACPPGHPFAGRTVTQMKDLPDPSDYPPEPGREQFIGKVQAWKDEYEQRPVLIWSEGGRSFRFEDLNSPS